MPNSINLNNDTILVSIIIPFRNTKIKQFEELINNLQQLHLDSVETIFVNDHSDNIDCYEQLISKIKNHKLLSLSGEDGVSSARNFGIEDATGKYITFIDSDDLVNPYTFNYFLESSPNKDMYIFEQGVFRNDNKPIYSKNFPIIDIANKEEITDMFVLYGSKKSCNLSFSMRSACAKFYKRTTAIPLFDEELRFYEDSLFVAKFIFQNAHIDAEIVNAIIYYYRIDFNSASRRFNKDYNELYQRYFDRYLFLFDSGDKFLLPIAFDSLSKVLPVKATQAVKKLHLLFALKLIKSVWAVKSSSILIDYVDVIDVTTLKVCIKINERHYVSCLIYILCNRIIKSITIRTNRLFKRGRKD